MDAGCKLKHSIKMMNIRFILRITCNKNGEKKTSTACTVVRGDSGMDVNEKCHDKINKDTHENQSKFQEPKH